jgi:hypothetical protein
MRPALPQAQDARVKPAQMLKGQRAQQQASGTCDGKQGKMSARQDHSNFTT